MTAGFDPNSADGGVLVFLFVHMMPGDPAQLATWPDADETVVQLVRQDLGLNKPLLHQFMHFFINVLRGDFGTSMVSKRPVSEEIASRFMLTFWLTITSMLWTVILGLAVGMVSVVWRNLLPYHLGMMLAILRISLPAFALGMLLMQVFSVNLGWLPTVGTDSWRHYILPSITLGAAVAAVMARFTCASLVEVFMHCARQRCA